jgi:hypothetical protein
MKITIQGQDYTVALDASQPLTITRRLGEPAVCRLWLSLAAGGSLALPTRNQSISVEGDDGTSYFTGFVATAPLAEYAGLGLEGSRYRIAIEAASGDLLTNSAPTSDTRSLTPILMPTVYRGATGSLVQDSVAGAVHPLDEDAGSLRTETIQWTAPEKRSLANDFTVCGDLEPTAYVTECQQGDGATTAFYLAGKPYFPPAAQENVITESFNENALDPRVWSNTGSPGYLELGGGGLSMQGGRGTDGTTMLTWIDPVEMGGTLLFEAAGVTLQAGSTGILPGLFAGVTTQAGCIAGFLATAAEGSGDVTLQPLVSGAPAGSTFAVNSANLYTLRVRVHCPENQRELSIFCAFDGTTLQSYGGQTNVAPARLLFEIQEFVDGVAAMPVMLFDGTLGSLPPTCIAAAASSINLQGSIRSIHLQNLGSGWVTTTPSGGGPQSRRIGTLAESAECQLDRSGKLSFFTGYTPPAGALIAVNYRLQGRAAGRAQDAAGQAALTAAGLPPVAAWQGTVVTPSARCSQDCRNAAQALAAAAAEPGKLWKGTCRALRNSLATDVQPGDALQLNASSSGFATLVVVRSVTLSYRPSVPDLIAYSIDFANDWADELGIHASETVPPDTLLPAPVGLTVLANLSTLTVTSISGTTITVDAGTTAPTGGGFEVRRRDNAFAPGEDADLVLRSTTATMSFTRATANDRFYIRMYDGSTPPNYSEFSAALFFNLPLGS